MKKKINAIISTDKEEILTIYLNSKNMKTINESLNEFLKEEINNDLAISIGKEIISALPKKPKKGNSYTFRIEIE